MMFDVTIRSFPTRQAVTLAHRGSYQHIGRAFEQVGAWFALRGLLTASNRMVGIYYDDPAAVQESELRSAAGIIVENIPAVDPPYEVTTIAGGEYAVTPASRAICRAAGGVSVAVRHLAPAVGAPGGKHTAL